jgi:hypothetical protein
MPTKIVGKCIASNDVDVGGILINFMVGIGGGARIKEPPWLQNAINLAHQLHKWETGA